MADILPAFDAFHGTAAAGAVTNIDYALTQELFISIQVLLKGHAWGDSFAVFNIDDDKGTVSGTAGSTLATLFNSWNVNGDVAAQTIPALQQFDPFIVGTILRIAYTSTGASPVQVYANLGIDQNLDG